jgi:hypothetical protein
MGLPIAPRPMKPMVLKEGESVIVYGDVDD